LTGSGEHFVNTLLRFTVHCTFPKVNDPDCLQMQADVTAETYGTDELFTKNRVLSKATKCI